MFASMETLMTKQEKGICFIIDLCESLGNMLTWLIKEKYFNYIRRLEVCKDTKRAKVGMQMFITAVTCSCLVIRGCAGDFGRCSETALTQRPAALLFTSATFKLAHTGGCPASHHILHNAAESKPAGGGVRKKGRGSDCCLTAAPLVETPKARWMQNAVLRRGYSLGSLHFSCWILLPTPALKVCLCVAAGGLRMSSKANSKKQPTQREARDLELESTTSRQQTASKLASTDTPAAPHALSSPPK